MISYPSITRGGVAIHHSFQIHISSPRNLCRRLHHTVDSFEYFHIDGSPRAVESSNPAERFRAGCTTVLIQFKISSRRITEGCRVVQFNYRPPITTVETIARRCHGIAYSFLDFNTTINADLPCCSLGSMLVNPLLYPCGSRGTTALESRLKLSRNTGYFPDQLPRKRLNFTRLRRRENTRYEWWR